MGVQQFPDIIRVTFNSEGTVVKVLNFSGVRLFDMWCRMDGGPPSTMVHLFDYPYEEDAAPIDTLFKTYVKVKGIRHQKYISTHRDNGGSVANFVRGFFFSRRLARLRRREKKIPLTKFATERPIVPVCKVETSYCFVT